MKNPMWFAEKNFQKVRAGTRSLERELVRSTRSLNGKVGLDAKFAAEVLRQVIRRLMLVMIGVGLQSLVRQLMPARPPSANLSAPGTAARSLTVPALRQ